MSHNPEIQKRYQREAWAWGAVVVSNKLLKMIQARHARSDEVTPSVYSCVREFFYLVRIALEGDQGHYEHDLGTAEEQLRLSSKILSAMNIRLMDGESRDEAQHRILRDFINLVNNLQQDHNLEDEEIKTAGLLSQFLQRLKVELDRPKLERARDPKG